MTLSAYPNRTVVTATDLSTDPDVFPIFPGRELAVNKAPNWATLLKTSASGREIRNARYASPLYDFGIKHEFLRDRVATPELQKLLAFFNSRQGRFGFFFLYDASDNAVPAGTAFGTGDGATLDFQLQRIAGAGSPYATPEPVYATWMAPVIKVNGVIATPTINPWGVVHFTSAPAVAAALTWSGTFLWVCRFDQDQMDLAQLTTDLWSQSGLKVRSIRP